MRLLIVPAVLVLAASAAGQDKPKVQPLDMKGVELNHDGSAPKPVVIASAEELAKAKIVADDASRDALKKQVDFGKQKLVVLAWSGSGGDRLAPGYKGDGKSATLVLTYSAGFTDDLRRHGYAYAIPKDVAVEVK